MSTPASWRIAEGLGEDFPPVTLRPHEVGHLYGYLQRSRPGQPGGDAVLREMAGYLWAALLQGEARAVGVLPAEPQDRGPVVDEGPLILSADEATRLRTRLAGALAALQAGDEDTALTACGTAIGALDGVLGQATARAQAMDRWPPKGEPS
ncbi:MAG: hypothetical protein ACRCZP_13085 [Phycicoccus sp.]